MLLGAAHCLEFVRSSMLLVLCILSDRGLRGAKHLTYEPALYQATKNRTDRLTAPIELHPAACVPQGPNRTVPRDDVAEVCIQSLMHPAYANRAFDLASLPPGALPGVMLLVGRCLVLSALGA